MLALIEAGLSGVPFEVQLHNYSITTMSVIVKCATPGSAARAMRVLLRPATRWRSMLLRATAEADVLRRFYPKKQWSLSFSTSRMKSSIFLTL